MQLAASDGGRTATRQCTVQVSNGASNVSPVIAGGADSVLLATAEDSAGSVLVTGSDVDGDPLSWTIQAQGTYGTAVVTASGSPVTVTYTPDHDAHGTDAVVVRLEDGRGGTDTITISVTISPINDAPIWASPLADQTVTVGSAMHAVVPSDMVTDVDGDVLTWAAAGLPAWLEFHASTRTFSGTPMDVDVGMATIILTVSDGSLAVSDSFAVTIVAEEIVAEEAASGADVSATDDGGCGFGGNGIVAIGLFGILAMRRRA